MISSPPAAGLLFATLIIVIVFSVANGDHRVTLRRSEAAGFIISSSPATKRTHCSKNPNKHRILLPFQPTSSTTMTTRGGGPNKKMSEHAMDPDEKMETIAKEALSSMRFCYKACFAGFIAAVFETVMEFNILTEKAFTWVEFVDVCDSLNLLVFGLGIRKVASIYAADWEKDEAMSADTVYDLCSTSSSLWRNTALVMVGVSMVLSVSLVDHLSFISDRVAIPGVVATIALVAGLVLIRINKDNASKVVLQEKNEAVKPGFEKARSAGFTASRNMRLCTGAFTLMAAVELVKWLLTPADLVSRFFSVWDFITPGTIAGLQLALYKSYLRAVVNVTGGGRSAKATEYADLLEAQKGFYHQVGETVTWAAAFGILPYAYSFVKPFLLKVVKIVAPSFAGEL